MKRKNFYCILSVVSTINGIRDMKVYNITSTNFGTGVCVRAAKNRKNKYLYNQILAMTNEYKIPANFLTDKIQLPSVTNQILNDLKKLEIKY